MPNFHSTFSAALLALLMSVNSIAIAKIHKIDARGEAKGAAEKKLVKLLQEGKPKVVRKKIILLLDIERGFDPSKIDLSFANKVDIDIKVIGFRNGRQGKSTIIRLNDVIVSRRKIHSIRQRVSLL